MIEYPQRKRTRLPQANYANPSRICSVTVAVRKRRPVFSDSSLASEAVSILRALAEARAVRVFAFCVMPDHVHLVLSPSETCSVSTFVGQFKNLVLRASWKLGLVGSFWQEGFWDHFVREEEDLRTVVEYVLANPVPTGIVNDWRSYRFCGSLELEV